MILAEGEKHGTQYSYRIRKCRCDECRAWNTASQSEYRRSKREGTPMSNRRKMPAMSQPRQAATTPGYACFICTFQLKVAMLSPENPGPLPSVGMAITLAPVEVTGMARPEVLPVCLDHFPASDRTPSRLVH